ncbi:hypothetical protein BG015_009476 [Linnemannia schmuckeri]|uniref:Uncharacterized protein n=1 Tax=Linnemannia schmuckeri TaxID=64567 RepID=A0A9P5V9B8_9FUNG|nr:hypothetical protein BG015_009476 [Linnemannia schmuckeri]
MGLVRQIKDWIETLTGIFLFTLAKWCSLRSVYGRKFLFHAGLAGTVLYITLNWFAASGYSFMGHYVYCLEAVCLCLLPASSAITPSCFAYFAEIVLKVSLILAAPLAVYLTFVLESLRREQALLTPSAAFRAGNNDSEDLGATTGTPSSHYENKNLANYGRSGRL